MCTIQNNQFVTKKYPTHFKQVNIPHTRTFDFLMGYIDNKCIGIYEHDKYPLITAKSDNEEFEVIVVNNDNYILKTSCNNLTEIYGSNGKRIFSLDKNKQASLIKNNYNKLNLNSKNNMNMDSLLICIYENNKTSIIYDVLNKKEFIKSKYINSSFYYDTIHNLYLEVNNNLIKSIFGIKGYLILSSINSSFEIVKYPFCNTSFIKEFSEDKICMRIYMEDTSSYYLTSYKPLCSSNAFDLSIKKANGNCIIIAGKVNNKCKCLKVFNIDYQLIASRILKGDNYFDVSKNNVVQVIRNNKCTSILRYEDLKEIVSVNSTSKNYFRIDNNRIYKLNCKNNCNTIYTIDGTKLISTDRKDINISICKSKFPYCKDEYYFYEHYLFNKDNKCISIIHDDNKLPEIPGITYEICTSNKEELIYGYIVKNNRRIGIFDFKLKTIISFEDDSYIKVIDFYIENDFDDTIRVNFSKLNILYMKYDKDGKCREVCDENYRPVLNAKKGAYFELYNSDYLMSINEKEKCNNVFSIRNCKVSNILSTTDDNHYILPFKPDDNNILFGIYDINSNSSSIVVEDRDCFVSIVDNYEHIYYLEKFNIIQTNNSKKLTLLNKNKFSEKISTFELFSKSGGNLKIDTKDPNFIFAYEEVLDTKTSKWKTVVIYKVNESGFHKVIESDEGITPIYVASSIFFKVGKNTIYNKVGNLI